MNGAGYGVDGIGHGVGAEVDGCDDAEGPG